MATLEQLVTIQTGRDTPLTVELGTLLAMRGQALYQFLAANGFSLGFRDVTFDDIMAAMLARVPDTLDKREGSIIYDALAGAATEITQAYVERYQMIALSYASHSAAGWLDLRVAEHGVYRIQATTCRRMLYLWADAAKTIPFTGALKGTVFSVPNEKLNYTTLDEPSADTGGVMAEANIPGADGNGPATGNLLIPNRYSRGLAVAELGEITTLGIDTETDASLYDRFVQEITRPPFGGNRSDYELKLKEIGGVGPAKIYRATPNVGHVTITCLASDILPPNATEVATIQARLDPTGYEGEGVGEAPMCHIVHVEAAEETAINISATVTLGAGYPEETSTADITAALTAYMLELRERWDDLSADRRSYLPTVVRWSYIETAILGTRGVVNVSQVQVNGGAANITMDDDHVPVLGTVTLTYA